MTVLVVEHEKKFDAGLGCLVREKTGKELNMPIIQGVINKAAPSVLPQPQVLGIEASPRKGGNSDVLLTHVLQGVAGGGVPADSAHLRDFQYQGCIGCERCRKAKICVGLNDGMSLLYPNIMQAGGLVLVSPTHNYNITAWMKAFIDRLYCFYNFENTHPRAWSSQLAGQDRKAVLVAVCEQVDTDDMGFTLEAMRLPIQALGYDIVGELPVFGVFHKAKVKEQPAVLRQAVELGEVLARAVGSASG